MRAPLLLALALACRPSAAPPASEADTGDTGMLAPEAPEWAQLEGAGSLMLAASTAGGAWAFAPADPHLPSPDLGAAFGFEVADLALGPGGFYALDAAGALHVWADVEAPESWTGAGFEGPFSALESRGRRVCLIRADTQAVWCLGVDEEAPEALTQVDPGPAVGLVSAAMGYCALLIDGSLRCRQDESPDRIEGWEDVPEGDFARLELVSDAPFPCACALDAAGSVACWGHRDCADRFEVPAAAIDLPGTATRILGALDGPCLLSDSGGFGCATYASETSQDRLDLPATLHGVDRAAVSGAGLCVAWKEDPSLACWDITGEWWDPALAPEGRGESAAWFGLATGGR